MKALIYTYSLGFAKDLAIELIPTGIECYKTSSREEALLVLDKTPDIILFITENWEFDFLTKVKEIRKDIYIFQR